MARKPTVRHSQSHPRGTAALPFLREIFDELRRGRHVCEADGEYYWAIHDHFDKYHAFFDQLGFTLVAHGRGFYHFHDATNFSDRARRMAIFMFVLIENLADTGGAVEEALLNRSFRVAELPHLHSDRCRGYMREADVRNEEELLGVLRGMEQLGFVQREDEGGFRFRRPVYRFMDLCLEVLADGERGKTGPVSEGAEDSAVTLPGEQPADSEESP